MLIVFPLLPAQLVPLALRNGLAIALLLPVYPVLRAALPESPDAPLNWLFYVAKEAAIGAALGWSFAIVIWAMEAVEGLLGIQTGTSSGATFDPLSQQPAAVYSHLLRNIAVAIFVGVGGLLVMLRLFYENLLVWPTKPAFPLSPLVVWDMAQNTSLQMLSLALSIVLPLPLPLLVLLLLLLLLLLIIELGLGLLNRSLPQLNVFSLSLPIKMVAALLLTGWALGCFSELIVQFLANLDGLARLGK